MATCIRKKQTEVTMSKMFYMCAWISTYFLLSLPTDVRKIPAWNTTLIPKGITSSLKSEHSDSLRTTIRCTFTAKFWPVINTLQTPGELTNSYRNTVGKVMPNKHLSLTNITATIEKFECNMISSLTIWQRRSKLIQIFLNNFDRCTRSCVGSKNRKRRDVTRDETEHEESTTKVTLTRGPLIFQQDEEPGGKFTYNVKNKGLK